MVHVLNLTIKQKPEWMRLDGDYHQLFYKRVMEFVPKQYRRYIHYKSPDSRKTVWYWEIDPVYFCRVFELAYEYYDKIYLDEYNCNKIDVFEPQKKQKPEKTQKPLEERVNPLIPITSYTQQVAFCDDPRDIHNQRRPPKYTFLELDNPPQYPRKGTIARIIYQEDGTIRAEYLPGVANFSVWIARWIPWSRWKQTGEGCWLGATVNEEEADYIRRLTASPWGEGGQCVTIHHGPLPLAEYTKAAEVPERETSLDPVFDVEFKCRENSDQLCLF
jgi:hypothetical protein